MVTSTLCQTSFPTTIDLKILQIFVNLITNKDQVFIIIYSDKKDFITCCTFTYTQ